MNPSGKPATRFVSAGDRFGWLTVTDPEPRTVVIDGKTRRRIVTCRCDCGTETTVRISSLVSGGTKSCGCRIPAVIADRSRTHGLSREPLYIIHQGMMRRCYSTDCKSYGRYGGRGIRVCTEWHDVQKFIAWVEVNLGPRPAGMSIDRINNDGDYEPGNVRWATAKEQAANRSKRTKLAPRLRRTWHPVVPCLLAAGYRAARRSRVTVAPDRRAPVRGSGTAQKGHLP